MNESSMFVFQVRYIACTDIYLSGIRGCLDAIARHQSGWNYVLSPYLFTENEGIHLVVVDATGYDTRQDFPPSLSPLLKRKSTLILVKALQRTLIDELVTTHPCSVLCVDEITFHMRDIIEMTSRNNRYLSSLAMRAGQQCEPEDDVRLTSAEFRIMNYFGQGFTGVEIAKRLYRSEKTISSHKRRIMKKLGAKSDIELSQKIHRLKRVLHEDRIKTLSP